VSLLSTPAARRAAGTLLVASWLLAPAARATAAETAADSLTLPPPSVRRWQTGMLRPDRLNHASLAFGIGVGVGILTREPLAGTGTALGIGLAKELIDDPFDRGDLLADAIGAGLAGLVVAALRR
jgi:hypothetical protein